LVLFKFLNIFFHLTETLAGTVSRGKVLPTHMVLNVHLMVSLYLSPSVVNTSSIARCKPNRRYLERTGGSSKKTRLSREKRTKNNYDGRIDEHWCRNCKRTCAIYSLTCLKAVVDDKGYITKYQFNEKLESVIRKRKSLPPFFKHIASTEKYETYIIRKVLFHRCAEKKNHVCMLPLAEISRKNWQIETIE
jgi:hypothetical protein